MLVIVQLPQGPLLLEALIIKKLVGCKILADVHSGFLMKWEWKSALLNLPFNAFLTSADLVMVHNEPERSLLPVECREKALVVYDPWNVMPPIKTDSERTRQYIVIPSSFAPDEPIEEILRSISPSKLNIRVYITGNWKRRPSVKKYASEKVVFTGYVPKEDYLRLIANSSAVVAGTKQEYTVLMSAWEAVAYGKPLALSETVTLRSLFQDYAVYYDWRNSQSIIEAFEKVLQHDPSTLSRENLRLRTLKSVRKLEKSIEKLSAPSKCEFVHTSM